MSSLSTLPKGDSAWLLRKAVERVMQQVSVLETNIGSSTTGNSANTQIIFNDAGTLRGDAGLTYNAATDTLSAGSATITGALTVDTTTLVVNPSGYPDRVGIGTASPAVTFDVAGPIRSIVSGGIPYLYLNNGTSQHSISNDSNALSISVFAAEQMRIAASGVFTWYDGAGGTRMTLNSTGLGVGVSPGVGFDLQQTSPMVRITGTSTTGYSSLTLRNTGASGRQYGLTLGGSGTGTNAGNLVITDDTASATRFVLDSSGNVGIGVTPITSHILSCSGPVGIAGTNAGTRTSYISNANACSIYYTDGGGSGYFTDFGNLIIQPRTSAARSVVIATGSTTPVERAVVKSTGQVRFVPLAADPAGAESGDVYYNSSSNKLKCYNGTTWNDLF